MKIGDSTIVVTEANSGLGKALVDEALRRGANRIYAGALPPFVHSDRRITPLIRDPTSEAIAEGWRSNALKALSTTARCVRRINACQICARLELTIYGAARMMLSEERRSASIRLER
jgi:hypothetical protein